LRVLVDTGAWFAWIVPDDPNHSLVAEWIDGGPEPLLTTDYCIDETLTLLVARKRPGLAIQAGRFFFQQDLVTLHYLTAEEIQRAWIFFQTRASAAIWRCLRIHAWSSDPQAAWFVG
jgi:predicted nucleic acid-binding protein